MITDSRSEPLQDTPYADALLTVGEKSPMGLLWTFIAFSPVVQVLSGLVELAAGLLLVWRRTAWLGGLLGTAALGVVALLNLTYDVPVLLYALVLTVGFALVALPEAGRIARFVTGRPTAGYTEPRPVPWPRVHAVSRWVAGALALLMFAGAGVGWWAYAGTPARAAGPLPGVYRVTADPTPPAARAAEDGRWAEIAFGQWGSGGEARFALRRVNGDLVEGRYRPAGDRVEIDLYPVLDGPRPLAGREVERTVRLAWSSGPDGTLTLSGDGQRLTAVPDPELRFLLDREGSWAPRPPVNR